MDFGPVPVLDLSSETSRTRHKDAFTSAAPISDRIKQCIAFLLNVQHITISDTTTDGNGDACLVLNVTIANNASPKVSGFADVALATVAHAEAAAGSESNAVVPTAAATNSESAGVTVTAAPAAMIAPDASTTADEAARASTSDGSTTTLQILRTFKELKELEKVVTHWSKKHVQLDARYGVPECTYCRHFYARETTKMWPGGALARLATSKRSLEQQFEACVNDYVAHARLPRPSDLECQGFDHIPSVVARFLLKELPLPAL